MTQREVEKQFYGRALASATTGYASTGYGMPVNQSMRFEEFKRQVLDRHRYPRDPWADYSLLDVGSGTGDLLEHLIHQGNAPARYLGLDIMDEMTQTARARFSGENSYLTDGIDVDFVTGDVTVEPETLSEGMAGDKFTYVASIAAYALKGPHESQQETVAEVQAAIDAMESLAEKAAFVTLFSTWKTNIIPEEMVLDPVTMFAWAKTRWERVDLIHSYAPFDFSLVIHTDKSPWRQEWEASRV